MNAPSYAEILNVADGFQGMMTPLSIALWVLLLEDQVARDIRGDMIEFGVYRGRSASVMALSARPEEQLTLVEIADYPDWERLAPLHPAIALHKARSETFVGSPEGAACGPFRFSHHDASHYFKNVETEVSFVSQKITPGGLIVLDDFGFTYSQVIAAYFHMRYVQNLPFEVFLIGGGKAYLCRRQDFPVWETFVLERLLPGLEAIGHSCALARTDNDPRHRAFFVEAKRSPDQPSLYGLKIWGDRFYKPAPNPDL